MNPFGLPASSPSNAGKALSVGRTIAVLLGVFVGLPILLIVGLFAYHISASTWISWRFNSHELNQKIVTLNAGWSHSSERRDVSSLFLDDISRDVLQQKLHDIGYECKDKTLIKENVEGELSCGTQGGYDAFCRRDVFLYAMFDKRGIVASILANAYENC